MQILATLIVLAVAAYIINIMAIPAQFKNIAYLILGIIVLVVLLRFLGVAI